MKHQRNGKITQEAPHLKCGGSVRLWMTFVQVVLLVLGVAGIRAQEVGAGSDDSGGQVLTRGPVHEAFAGIVSYNAEPGVIVEKAPPELIEELPPTERPEGDNISWIPGYWGWDDERSDHLWISGTWRALPPGRQWTTGYWGRNEQGHQWISGYWADASVREVNYLPKPPVTIEAGPNVASPSRDHSWSPGSWMWRQERYVWSPGYWAEGRADWDWTPSHYVWTPRGHIFVDGYWDYSFDRRGVLYAPVYFQSRQYSRPGYQYSPLIAIGLTALMDHMFLRPNYHHYYFGDYYDRRYRSNGYYSPYAYHSSRYGYDPVYSHRRWTHRSDRDWERNYAAIYDHRRDNESARPPRTWDAQKQMRLARNDTGDRKQMMIAEPFDQMAKNPDRPLKVETLSPKDRKNIMDRDREVRASREERRSVEAEGDKHEKGKPEQEIKPSKAKRPNSPIVGKAPDKFQKQQAPPKPQLGPIVPPVKEARDRRQDEDAPRTEPKSGKPDPRHEIDPKAKEKQRDVEPKAKEKQREIEPKAKEKQREIEPKAKEKQREIEPKAKEKQREIDPRVKERQREIEPKVKDKQREIEPKAKEKHREEDKDGKRAEEESKRLEKSGRIEK